MVNFSLRPSLETFFHSVKYLTCYSYVEFYVRCLFSFPQFYPKLHYVGKGEANIKRSLCWRNWTSWQEYTGQWGACTQTCDYRTSWQFVRPFSSYLTFKNRQTDKPNCVVSWYHKRDRAYFIKYVPASSRCYSNQWFCMAYILKKRYCQHNIQMVSSLSNMLIENEKRLHNIRRKI
jgi:hypothetical protein